MGIIKRKLPSSPITEGHNVKAVCTIDPVDIEKLYQLQSRIDVSRFFKNIPEITIYECQDTGYRFYFPESIMGDDLFYKELQVNGESNGSEYYRTNAFDHQYATTVIQPDEKVLEIGCGNGLFLESLSSKTRSVTGIELNRYAAELCRKRGLEIFDDLIEIHSQSRSLYYDVICIFQVLEHITDIRSFVDHALNALRPGGKLIISVPNCEPYFLRFNKYETYNLPPHHMGLWNKKVFGELEKYFPVKLQEAVYNGSYSWKADAYYRAKGWTGIKTFYKDHTIWQKLMMGTLLPFSALLSLRDNRQQKIHGGQICVMFTKI